jgi:hypothetical protein
MGLFEAWLRNAAPPAGKKAIFAESASDMTIPPPFGNMFVYRAEL